MEDVVGDLGMSLIRRRAHGAQWYRASKLLAILTVRTVLGINDVKDFKINEHFDSHLCINQRHRYAALLMILP